MPSSIRMKSTELNTANEMLNVIHSATAKHANLSRAPWRTEATPTPCFRVRVTAPYILQQLDIYNQSGQQSTVGWCTIARSQKWVSAFGLSNTNKWRWWIMVDSQPQLSEGCRPSGTQAAFTKWTAWTLAVTLSHNDSIINTVISILLLLLLLLISAGKLTSQLTVNIQILCSDDIQQYRATKWHFTNTLLWCQLGSTN